MQLVSYFQLHNIVQQGGKRFPSVSLTVNLFVCLSVHALLTEQIFDLVFWHGADLDPSYQGCRPIVKVKI